MLAMFTFCQFIRQKPDYWGLCGEIEFKHFFIEHLLIFQTL